MTTRRMAILGAWIGVAVFGITGAWSFLAPHSFFDALAPWRPYNRHLYHDVGALSVGIATGLLAGIAGRSGLAVGLWGGAVGATLHAISHWIDADRGGHAADPVLLTLLAIALIASLAVSERHARTMEVERR